MIGLKTNVYCAANKDSLPREKGSVILRSSAKLSNAGIATWFSDSLVTGVWSEGFGCFGGFFHLQFLPPLFQKRHQCHQFSSNTCQLMISYDVLIDWIELWWCKENVLLHTAAFQECKCKHFMLSIARYVPYEEQNRIATWITGWRALFPYSKHEGHSRTCLLEAGYSYTTSEIRSLESATPIRLSY